MKVLLSLLFILHIFDVTAQISNVVTIDVENSVPINSPSVAINPKKSSNILISIDYNKVFVTQDSGASWTPKIIPPTNGVIKNSRLSVDKKGSYVLFGKIYPEGTKYSDAATNAPLSSLVSTKNGMSWERGEDIDQTASSKTFAPNVAFSLASGDVYAGWLQEGGENVKPGVYFANSSSGRKWSTPVNLVHKPLETPQFPYGSVYPSAGPDGQIYVTWVQEGKIYLDRSYDKGKMWLRNDIKIADTNNSGTVSIPGWGAEVGRITHSTDNSKSMFHGTIYVVWSDQKNEENDTDIWLIKSANKGDSWTNLPVKIHEGGEGTHQFNPILKVDPTNGIVYILYMGLNSENTTDLYLAYSIDGGQSFKSVKVNETSFEGLPNRKSHDISVVNGVVCPVWLESNDGKIKLMASVITYKQLGID